MIVIDDVDYYYRLICGVLRFRGLLVMAVFTGGYFGASKGGGLFVQWGR
jgi:hypothetical protein